MTNQLKVPQPKKNPDQIGVWPSIGVAIGAGLGVVFHNIRLVLPPGY